MLRCLVLCATVLLAVSPSPPVSPASSSSPSMPVSSGAPSGSPAPASPLADALDGVPDTAATREQPVGYVDYRAVEQARPGAAQPTSFAALDALKSADDPSFRLWIAAIQGVASAPGEL